MAGLEGREASMRRCKSLLVGVFAAGSLVAVPAITTATDVASGHPPIVRIRQGTSTNWSGYSAFGAPGSFTSASATWTQPAVSCTSQKLNQAKGASAEVIVEAPWSGGTLPLANYGTVGFTGSKANGAGVGTFANVDPITMDNPYGMKSTPSGFSDAAKQNFSVNW